MVTLKHQLGRLGLRDGGGEQQSGETILTLRPMTVGDVYGARADSG